MNTRLHCFRVTVFACVGGLLLISKGQGIGIDPDFHPIFESIGNGAPPSISAIAMQGSGKILVSGAFAKVNGQAISGITRLNPDGTVDPSFIVYGSQASVKGLYPLDDGRFYRFGSGITRCMEDGNTDNSFQRPTFGGKFPSSMAVQKDGKIILGGVSQVNGVSVGGVARLLENGRLDTTFQAQVADDRGNTSSALVQAVALDSKGRIFIGGSFSMVDGAQRSCLARLRPNGHLDTKFNAPNLNGTIGTISLREGVGYPQTDYVSGREYIVADVEIIAGGSFSWSNVVYNLARFRRDGAIVTTLHPAPVWRTPVPGQPHEYIVGGEVNSIVQQADRKLMIGGKFNAMFNADIPHHFARIDDGMGISDTDIGTDGPVRAVALQGDGKILIGGDFTRVGNSERAGLARLTNDTPSSAQVRISTAASKNVVSYRDWLDERQESAGKNGGAPVANRQGPGLSSPWNLGFGSFPGGGGGLSASVNSLRTADLNWVSWDRSHGTAPMAQSVGFEIWDGDTERWIYLGEGTPVRGTAITGSYPWKISGLHEAAAGTLRITARYATGLGNTSNSVDMQVTEYTAWSLPHLQVIRKYETPQASGWGHVIPDGGAIVLSPAYPTASIRLKNTGSGPLHLYGPRRNTEPYTHSESALIRIMGDHAEDFGLSFSESGPWDQTSTKPVYHGSGVALDAAFSVHWNKRLAAGESPITENTWVEIYSNDPDHPTCRLPISTGWEDSEFANPVMFSTDDFGIASTAAQQDNERILVGGTFSGFGDVETGPLARFFNDGTVDRSFSAQLGEGWTMIHNIGVQADGKILVAGQLPGGGPNQAHVLRRLHVNGSLDESFQVTMDGGDTYANVLAIQKDGKILVGGAFETVNGLTRAYLARINPNGSLDSSFAPILNGIVTSVVVQDDDKILVCGNFTAISGVACPRFARLNSGGSVDLGGVGVSLQSPAWPWQEAILTSVAQYPDGGFLVAGLFDRAQAGGVIRTRHNIAKFKADGSLDTDFEPNVDNFINTMVVQTDGTVFIAGEFHQANTGVVTPKLARILPDGTVDANFLFSTSATVQGLVLQQDGKLLVINGYRNGRWFLARLANVNPPVSTLTVAPGGKIDWMRGGTAPMISQAAFESWDGANWQALGRAVKSSGAWTFIDPQLPASGAVRALGIVNGGFYNGSVSRVAQVARYGTSARAEMRVKVKDGVREIIRPLQLNLGEVVVGGVTTRVITISSTGTGVLADISAEISGAGLSVAAAPSPGPLSAGASTTLTIAFQPTAVGEFSGSLRLRSNDPVHSPYDLTLFGKGIPISTSPPNLALQTELQQNLAPNGTYEFETVTAGTAASVGLMVQNHGDSQLHLAEISLSGADRNSFEIGTPVTSQLLAKEEATRFIVTFKPLTAGAKSAILTIASNDPEHPSYRVTLYGTAEAVPTPGMNEEIVSSGVEWIDGGFGLHYSGTPGIFYRLEYSVDLETWEVIDVVGSDEEGWIDYVDEESRPGRGFYRLIR